VVVRCFPGSHYVFFAFAEERSAQRALSIFFFLEEGIPLLLLIADASRHLLVVWSSTFTVMAASQEASSIGPVQAKSTPTWN